MEEVRKVRVVQVRVRKRAIGRQSGRQVDRHGVGKGRVKVVEADNDKGPSGLIFHSSYLHVLESGTLQAEIAMLQGEDSMRRAKLI